MIASQLQTKAETARTSGNKANVLEMHSAVNFHFLRGLVLHTGLTNKHKVKTWLDQMF